MTVRLWVCTLQWHRLPPLAWLLIASPVLRWGFGPKPGRRWWQGWFLWPVEMKAS